MKEVTQYDYLCLLYYSKKFQKSFFGNTIGGTKADFEKICNASYKNSEFRKWLNELIELNILEFFEIRKTDGGKTSTYVINKKLILKKIKSMEHYQMYNRIHSDIYEGS